MNIFTYVADLMFPPKCIYCGTLLKPETRPLICRDCAENIPVYGNKCAKCGGELNFVDGRPVCTTCRVAGRYFDGCLTSAGYDGKMRDAILEFKFKYRMYMSDALAVFLTDKLREIGVNMRNIDYITSVPCDIARQKERGFDSAGLIAKEVAKKLGIPYRNDVISKIRCTASQRGMNASQRAENVKGSYKTEKIPEVKGKSILLIDDILTTGATLMEVSRTLKRSGANYVFCAVVAKTD